MINFFRKKRKKLANDNKAIKYTRYAIGEIVLVVIGILIALSINNWNQNRLDRNLESQYYKRILEDLKEDQAILQATLNYAQQVSLHANKAIVVFENYDEINSNPVANLIDMYQASQVQYPSAAKSTYQELIASGQINLIKNDADKTSLIRYYEIDWSNGSMLTIQNDYRENLRGKMPNAIQTEIRSNCGDIYIKIRKTSEVYLPKECEVNIPINTAQLAVDLLRNDVELKKNLRFLIGNLKAKIFDLNLAKQRQQELINQFETTIQ